MILDERLSPDALAAITREELSELKAEGVAQTLDEHLSPLTPLWGTLMDLLTTAIYQGNKMNALVAAFRLGAAWAMARESEQ